MAIGGLIARYAIGLLYSKGHFDTIQPVVWSPTLSSGHELTPVAEFHHICYAPSGCAQSSARIPPSHLVPPLPHFRAVPAPPPPPVADLRRRNVLGARTLSASGRQLFTIDNFRGTGRPLLSALADRESAFYKGLQLFAHKTLYANVVNDRVRFLLRRWDRG